MFFGNSISLPMPAVEDSVNEPKAGKIENTPAKKALKTSFLFMPQIYKERGWSCGVWAPFGVKKGVEMG